MHDKSANTGTQSLKTLTHTHNKIKTPQFCTKKRYGNQNNSSRVLFEKKKKKTCRVNCRKVAREPRSVASRKNSTLTRLKKGSRKLQCRHQTVVKTSVIASVNAKESVCYSLSFGYTLWKLNGTLTHSHTRRRGLSARARHDTARVTGRLTARRPADHLHQSKRLEGNSSDGWVNQEEGYAIPSHCTYTHTHADTHTHNREGEDENQRA